MDGLRNFLVRLFSGSTSYIILILFILGFVLLISAYVLSCATMKDLDKYSEKKFKKRYYWWTVGTYNAFHAFASILPLLGMLGTVVALLKIDFSGDMEGIKGTFFLALDTTLYGLAGSIVLKFFNAFFQTKIETAIDKLSELMNYSFIEKD